MKKIFMAIALCLMCATIFTSCCNYIPNKSISEEISQKDLLKISKKDTMFLHEYDIIRETYDSLNTSGKKAVFSEITYRDIVKYNHFFQDSLTIKRLNDFDKQYVSENKDVLAKIKELDSVIEMRAMIRNKFNIRFIKSESDWFIYNNTYEYTYNGNDTLKNLTVWVHNDVNSSDFSIVTLKNVFPGTHKIVDNAIEKGRFKTDSNLYIEYLYYDFTWEKYKFISIFDDEYERYKTTSDKLSTIDLEYKSNYYDEFHDKKQEFILKMLKQENKIYPKIYNFIEEIPMHAILTIQYYTY